MTLLKDRPALGKCKTELFSLPLGRIGTVSTTPLRLILGGLFTIAAVLLVALSTSAFFLPDIVQGPLLYGLCYGACAVLGLLTCLRWRITSTRLATGLSLAAAALLPIVTMTMVEALNRVFTWDWSPNTLLINYVLYLVFYGIVYVCTGSLRWPMLIVNPLVFLLGMTNYYVMEFRGTPFVPMDFFSIGTALEVAPGYDFSLSYLQVIAILLLAFILIISARLYTPKLRLEWRIALRVFFGALSACVICVYMFTDLYANAGLKPDYWNQARGYRRTGVVLNFCLNTKYLFVSEPDGYDPDQIPAIVTDPIQGATVDELGLIPAVDAPTKTPNIICIMNESLSDLSVLGDVQTNIPYFTYLNSLTENTIRGNLAVSVLGGGTSNSEFEFLTGTPMAFFPTGSNAYTLYIDSPLESMVSALEQQGYTSTAYHPYYARGWNRVPVYEYMGFDHTRFIEDMLPASVLNQYYANGNSILHLQQAVEEYLPGEDVMLRQYVSDRYDYKELIRMYENRDPDKPFYLFNVTMQNHGGYKADSNEFYEPVYITGVPEGSEPDKDVTTAYPKANQFLSLMRYSDAAIAELIHYFQQQDEPTVICIFGDHQPTIEEDYVQALLGVDDLYNTPVEVTQKRYTTPFVIWANYDIPEQELPLLSANYLSSYVMKVAGMTEEEMPLYNQYLLKLSETLPVVSGICVVDNNGTYYEPDKNPYGELLADYEKVVYNHLFDEEKCHKDLYNKP
ncbi:MAG: LTA synthase family protein [Clostridia bacterium]|nr:LTA synthase family protein [Clostridia bacterium]